MRRWHLFEFSDLPWLPRVLREGFHALLKKQEEEIYLALVPKLQEFLTLSGSNQVLDLCSGTAGPWEMLLPELQAQGLDLSVTLSDKYPPRDPTYSSAYIQYIDHPVDAMKVPPEHESCRTLFTCFHHFQPQQALEILKDAVQDQNPIGVFEFTQRKWQHAVGMLLSPVWVLIQMPFVKPLKWQWLLFTYLIPLIPLIYFWDGLVSHLRTYTNGELQYMISQLTEHDYIWEIGYTENSQGLQKISYLIGRPRFSDKTERSP